MYLETNKQKNVFLGPYVNYFNKLYYGIHSKIPGVKIINFKWEPPAGC